MADKLLTLTETNARAAYQKASKSKKEWMKEMYPDFNFEGSIMDRVKSYEDACREEGITPLTIDDFAHLPKQDRNYHFCDHKYTVIRRVLNEGWIWKIGTNGYYPIFNRGAAGGSGFSFSGYYGDYSFSSVGARRTFDTPEKAIYAGKQFLDIHAVIHNEE